MAAKSKMAYVLRFNDAFLPPGKSTIVEHNKIFFSKGKVWIGKMGRPLASQTLELISEHSDFYFIMLKPFSKYRRNTGAYAYISKVCAATTTPPPPTLIPQYYRYSDRVSAWFCLSDAIYSIEYKELLAWTVHSSGKLLLDSMNRSTGSFFVASRKPGKISKSESACMTAEDTHKSFDVESPGDTDSPLIDNRSHDGDIERLLAEFHL